MNQPFFSFSHSQDKQEFLQAEKLVFKIVFHYVQLMYCLFAYAINILMALLELLYIYRFLLRPQPKKECTICNSKMYLVPSLFCVMLYMHYSKVTTLFFGCKHLGIEYPLIKSRGASRSLNGYLLAHCPLK